MKKLLTKGGSTSGDGGFTLIELLIVIALLGALAVGLLAALDPFEQLKKGTDTGTRNTVSEVHGAIIRYYSVKQEMPWGTASVDDNLSSGYTSAFSLPLIISAGELKADFSQLAGTAQLRNISMIGTSEGLTVCFAPQSRSMQNDPNTRYEETNLSDTGVNAVSTCGTPGSTDFHCMWCVR